MKPRDLRQAPIRIDCPACGATAGHWCNDTTDAGVLPFREALCKARVVGACVETEDDAPLYIPSHRFEEGIYD